MYYINVIDDILYVPSILQLYFSIIDVTIKQSCSVKNTTIVKKKGKRSHQNTSSGGLSGNQLAGPVLGLGHKSPLELLALAGRFLLLLLRVIWGELGLLATAEEGERTPEKHDQQSGEEGEDARQEEAPPFPLLEAVYRGLHGRVFGRHPGGSLLPPGHTFTGDYHNHKRQLRRPVGRTLCAS